jgi:small subunit ribosomal protein S14
MKKNSPDKKIRFLFKQQELKLLVTKILSRTINSLSKVVVFSHKASAKFSLVQVKNRCVLTGRSKGTYAGYRISRIKLRELTLDGLVNGLKKASW